MSLCILEKFMTQLYGEISASQLWANVQNYFKLSIHPIITKINYPDETIIEFITET